MIQTKGLSTLLQKILTNFKKSLRISVVLPERLKLCDNVFICHIYNFLSSPEIRDWVQTPDLAALSIKCILLCKDHGILRAIPFGYQTYPLFFILNLCSASRDKTGSCDLTLKNPWSSHNQHHTLCAVTFFTGEKKIEALGCHSSFSDKGFWIGYVLCWISDWFISYFKIGNFSIPELCFDFSDQKKKYDCWKKILFVIPERLTYWLGQQKHA